MFYKHANQRRTNFKVQEENKRCYEHAPKITQPQKIFPYPILGPNINELKETDKKNPGYEIRAMATWRGKVEKVSQGGKK